MASDIEKTNILTQNLQDANTLQPIMHPKDFTLSWRAAKDQKRSLESFDEEEDEEEEEKTPKVEPVPLPHSEAISLKEELRTVIQEPPSIDMASQETTDGKSAPFKFKEIKNDPIEENLQPLPEPQTVPAIEKILEQPITAVVPALTEMEKETLLQTGVKEGLRLATAQYEKEQATTINSLNSICKEIFQNKKELFHHMQENFLHLASSLAESIVGKELQLHPEKIGPLIHQAIDASIHEETFTISVSPDLYARLMALENFEYRHCLVAKEGFSFGQFRVESATTTLESDIRKIVSELISQSDIHVLDSIEKPS